jgi:predicted nucleotidyltransferase component of viral defense system
MITEAELRRRAGQWRVDPMVVDLDYSLGWFLAGLLNSGLLADRVRFKGGTCLRKCYFADYRFSEDIDFTATAHLAPDQLIAWINAAARWSQDHDGPAFDVAPPRVEVIQDDYGSESFQARVYWRGPLRWAGGPRSLRTDITRDERLLLPSAPRKLIHPYTDVERVVALTIPCYSLEEILAEKLRAVGGQRRFAISRDLYDIHHLVKAGVSLPTVAQLLPAKFEAKGLEMSAFNVAYLEGRRKEFEQDWRLRLSYLVPAVDVDFTAAWTSTMEAIEATGSNPPPDTT